MIDDDAGAGSGPDPDSDPDPESDPPDPERVEALLRRLYREFVADVGEREAAVGWPAVEPESEADLDAFRSVAVDEELADRYEAWAADATATRSVAGGVVVEALADDPLAPAVGRVLVGLDLAIAALDDFVDTGTLSPDCRQRLAVSVAFPALLSFTNVGDAEPAVDATIDYLAAAARIPAVERRSFAYRSPSDGETDRAFVRSVYAARAEDIAGFVTIPAAILDLDADATDRAAADLLAYRARQLLIDDIEDVAVDRHDGIETPVAWLLATRERDAAAALLRWVYDSFEPADPPAPYSDALRTLERDDAIIEGLADPDSDPAR